MKQLIYLILAIIIPVFSQAQLEQPVSTPTGFAPNFNSGTKAPGDSCGVYYNEYIGLNKTSTLFFENLDTVSFEARAQLFNCPQPMEISGMSFYAFETNPLKDSLMAIAHLYDYEPIADTVGTLLAVDTVWVKHQAFSFVLPDVEVFAVFDPPITVTDPYMVAVFSPEDDSLKLLTSDFVNGDGAAEAVSYIYYSDPLFPSFHGWYNAYDTYGVNYDGDYLINPLIKYDLHDDFLLTEDTICPNVVSAGCVSYSQLPIYGDPHYNGFSGTQADHMLWLWGDGFQNTNLLSACHTYTSSGDFDITLSDTLNRYYFDSPFCIAEITNPIHVKLDVVPSFTYVSGGTIINFTNTSANTDSVWWDFGDLSAGTNQENPWHDYGVVDTFDVWLYAYNDCGDVDSTMIEIITDNVGIDDYLFDFKMYPNPANNSVVINGLVDGASVELINVLGQTIAIEQVIGSSIQLQTDIYNNGSYFVRVTTDVGQVTKKLVIHH